MEIVLLVLTGGILWCLYKFWRWAPGYADKVDKYLDERAEFAAQSKTAEAARRLEDMVGFTEDEVAHQRQLIDGEAS